MGGGANWRNNGPSMASPQYPPRSEANQMKRRFFAVALLATVAAAPLSANAQPVPSCPPGTFTPACARDPHGSGNDLPPFRSDVDPKSRLGHAGTIGHGAAHVGGSHGGGAGGHGGGGGGGGG